MNLRGVANSLTSAINPNIVGTVQQSTGYTTGPDFKQIPSYISYPATLQVQALSTKELQQLDSLNIQGNIRKVFLNGDWNGIVRPSGTGGDLIVFNNQNWKIALVIEQWPDWTSCAVVQQL